MVCIGCLKVMLMFVYVTLCAEWLEFTACYVCQVVCPELKVSMIRYQYITAKKDWLFAGDMQWLSEVYFGIRG